MIRFTTLCILRFSEGWIDGSKLATTSIKDALPQPTLKALYPLVY
jgi:hypothetical protein